MDTQLAIDDHELRVMAECAMTAGVIANVYYASTHLKVDMKANGSPVTEADRASNSHILRGLQHRLGIPLEQIMSEEKEEPIKGHDTAPRFDLKHCNDYFSIDSLDGTQDFLDHTDEYSVMIGKVIDGVPVKGVVYQPTTQKLWYATLGNGAWLRKGMTDHRLHVGDCSVIEDAAVVLSRSKARTPQTLAAESQRFKDGFGFKDVHFSGSFGIKVGRICEKQDDCYLNESSKAGIWDAAAPTIILREAGGTITTLDGKELILDPRNGLYLRQGALCSNGHIHAALTARYAASPLRRL